MPKTATELLDSLRRTKDLLANVDVFADVFDDAIEFLERLVKPLSLDECRDVFNEREYRFYPGEKHLPFEPWEVDEKRQVVQSGLVAFTKWEANALAMAFTLDKEAVGG
jgi:hypothetical protein